MRNAFVPDQNGRPVRMGWVIVALLLFVSPATAQQITIDRVEAMPALPSDYLVPDWKARARAFDAFAFDTTRSGDGLPLAFTFAAPNGFEGFGLTTFAGERRGQTKEAISALPALVSASLVGQPRADWVGKAQAYFASQPAERVYLNSPGGRSGDDWWYDTMPNVFFYQLYDRYGAGTGDLRSQFVTVANRWLTALDSLGGDVRPWARPFLGYRGFALSTMEPNRSGVIEPEAAGALAWIMWMAYDETGEDRYRVGAEWALQFLEDWDRNPSYELQLPYGALAAARANAELGARYDVEQLVRWSFEVGDLRKWGTFTDGDWNGYSAAGLVGSVNDFGGYAFALNGFQQAAALVPLVRYDDRFARSIGRWMTNLASASRLFYPDYLPDDLQSNAAWSDANDPAHALPYEALRRRGPSGQAPYASGDAVQNGWATTNLSTYSGASAGYLAAIVDTTDVPGILRLDLRATDFFAPPSYASYLYYNPHSDARTVALSLPFGRYDLYDAASDAMVLTSQSGTARIPIGADAARVIVVLPAGATTTATDGVLRAGAIAIDYRYGAPTDLPPRVRALAASQTRLGVGESATLWCTPYDPDPGLTVVYWDATGGTIMSNGSTATFSAPQSGDFDATCVVEADGKTVSASIRLRVLDNRAPESADAQALADGAEPGEQIALTCDASDPDGDELTYSWTTDGGAISGAAAASWTLPSTPGLYAATCIASDPSGETTTDTTRATSGTLVFRAQAESTVDASPYARPLVLTAGAQTGQVDGRLAFVLDGIDDVVRVDAGASLLPRRAVTASAWIRPLAFERERFVVSHGSWQQRYKISLTPDGVPRWSVRTESGVIDLDAPTAVALNEWTHVAATFDGTVMRLYVGFEEVASTEHPGLLPTVDLPLLIGQMLPGQPDYNFAGAIADVSVFNVALTADEIRTRTVVTSLGEPAPTRTLRAYPSPARSAVTIEAGVVQGRVEVFDLLGRRVAFLADGIIADRLTWSAREASGVYLIVVTSGETVARTTVIVL